MASWRDNVDGGQQIDWGRSSADYGEFRPGPPTSFYSRLRAFDIGCPGQRILDLGTGTGVLAREFARGGSVCAGVDLSAGQIAQAKQLAQAEAIEFSHESWRGRLRALRGIGPTLSQERIAEFAQELKRLLAEIAPPRFTVLHRIDAHVFQFKQEQESASGLPSGSEVSS